MTGLKIGDIEKLAQAIADNPTAPNVDDYLITLGLNEEEIGSVKEHLAGVNAAVRNPTDSPVPTIVSGGWL